MTNPRRHLIKVENAMAKPKVCYSGFLFSDAPAKTAKVGRLGKKVNKLLREKKGLPVYDNGELFDKAKR